MSETETTAPSKRKSFVKKVFVSKDKDGNRVERRSAHDEITSLEFQWEPFTDGKPADVTTVTLDKISKPNQIAAIWHGLAQKIGDAMARAETATVSERVDLVEAAFEALAADSWVTVGDGGPRTSMLVDAIVALLEKAGQTVDAARKAAIGEKLKDNEERKAAMANAQIAAMYESIKLARTQERLAKLQASAKDAKPATELGF